MWTELSALNWNHSFKLAQSKTLTAMEFAMYIDLENNNTMERTNIIW